MSSRPAVHIAMGRALERAQWLETEVGTVLLAVDALETRSFLKPDGDAYLRLRDAIDHQTLGRSLKKMQEFLKFEQNPESLFARALEARNFLIHHLVRHYSLALLDETKHPEIVAHIQRLESEMDAAYAVAQHLSGRLVNVIDQLRRKFGIEA